MRAFAASLALGMLITAQNGIAQPVGSPFRINTTTTGNQGFPSVAAISNVNYIVVWAGAAGASTFAYGRRFSSRGLAAGAEFRVNADTPGDQSFPRVDTDLAGNFAVRGLRA